MANKTILITNDNKNTLTSFNKIEANPYDDFQKQKNNFKRNSFKNKINDFEISFNPFVSAASQILKYVNETMDNNEEDMNKIHENCIQKINFYGENALKLGSENTEILVTRYILCTFTDELMGINFSKYSKNWSNNSLLNFFHKETYGGENFFHLLDKFLKTPAKYIHILELMYFCLALGFEGRYRIIDRGEIELNNIKESLYRQIKIVQGTDSYKFYTKQEASKVKYRLFTKVPYLFLFFGILILICAVYLVLTFSLSQQNDEFLSRIENKLETIDIKKGIKNYV